MVRYNQGRTLAKEQEETGGLGTCPQIKFWRPRPLERLKMPFCTAGYSSLFSLIFMVRRTNGIPNMFSSNFNDVDRKGTRYDSLVCKPKLHLYAEEIVVLPLLHAKA